MKFTIPFKIKKVVLFLIILLFFGIPVFAQNEDLDIKDYGFQITEMSIPKLAPTGYKSILTVELNDPLYPKKEYEVGFWIIGKQLRDRGYSYPIVVFPSNFMGRVEREVFDLVESVDIMPALKVNPPPSYSGQGHFKYIIRPDTLYNYVTVALKNSDGGQTPIDFQKDVTVTGVFVRPLRAKTNERLAIAESDEKIAKIQTDSIPEVLAERKLMDSNKSYTVSESSLQIGLYDHRNIDNDIVTIYLNQKIIVENLQLKRKKQFFEILLKPGENTITLHAENLGEVAPNTAAILIKSRSEEFMAVLESDLGQSEFFTIVYRPE